MDTRLLFISHLCTSCSTSRSIASLSPSLYRASFSLARSLLSLAVPAAEAPVAHGAGEKNWEKVWISWWIKDCQPA